MYTEFVWRNLKERGWKSALEDGKEAALDN
jgi:hypothetical protein